MATKVLMVCLGNICRSPLAEGILRSMVDPEQVFIDSAGTGGYHIGERPDPRAISIAKKYGIDISDQRCRKFAAADFEQFDLIYAMDKSNFARILELAKTTEHKKKVSLLLKQGKTSATEVPDPYFGGEQGFEEVFRLIDKACERIAVSLKQNDR